MKTSLAEVFRDSSRSKTAQEIIKKCVHCGFCNASCPTYRLSSEELDGPRGRIYQIKNLLESGHASAETQLHLDRCLTCRRCETVCPSSVEYGKLVDLARHWLEPRLKRSFKQTLLRRLMLNVLPYPKRLAPLLKIGQFSRPLLPQALRTHIPIKEKKSLKLSAFSASHGINDEMGTVILPRGCVQSIARPNTNQAATDLLRKLGYHVIEVSAQCCGALSHHLGVHHRTQQFMRANVEQWYQAIKSAPSEPRYIVHTASACGLMIKDYHHILESSEERDKVLMEQAKVVSQSCFDLCELLQPDQLRDYQNNSKNCQTNRTLPNIAFHSPCTLQHGQKISGRIERLLGAVGFSLVPFADSDQCCGSAGSYSVLQPQIAKQLKAKKLTAIQQTGVDLIATANIGCQLFLESEAEIPVRHWIELINDQM